MSESVSPEAPGSGPEKAAQLEARARRLAREKSHLQLVNNLMNQLSEVPGLGPAAAAIVRLILDHLGGTNVILYCQVGGQVHYTDVYGVRKVLETVEDPLARAAWERRELVEEVLDFAHTRMLLPAFTSASYWAMPLAVGSRLVGVIKMEGMLMAASELRTQLRAFFHYAALVLKNEVDSHLKLLEAAQLAAIVESSQDAIIGKTLGGVITSWNQSAQRIYGYTSEEAIGRPVGFLAPPGREREVVGLLAQIEQGLAVETFETVRRRKDGQIIHVSLTISPVRNAEGKVVGASAVARDTTERKRLEQERLDLFEQTRQDAQIRASLLDEVNHRVKNNLLNILGLMQMGQAKAGGRTPDPAQALASLRSRIEGMMAVHDLLTRAHWQPLPLGDLARQILAGAISSSSRQEPVELRLEFNPPEGIREEIIPRQAAALALILNELATNSQKHALAGWPRGILQVGVVVAPPESGLKLIEIDFLDNGPGWPDDVLAEEREGTGLRLIRGTLRSLPQGRLALSNQGGARAQVSFKLAAQAAPQKPDRAGG